MQFFLGQVLCLPTKEEVERQDAVQRITQDGEDEGIIADAVQLCPVEMAGEQPERSHEGHGKADKLFIVASGADLRLGEGGLHEGVDTLPGGFGDVQENDGAAHDRASFAKLRRSMSAGAYSDRVGIRSRR